MGYYEKHIFICDNQRGPDERQSCGSAGAEVLKYLKPRFKEAYRGTGKIRVQKCGCLDRCEQGPVVVSYPEGHWFRLRNQQDAQRFLESYIANNDRSAIEDLIIDDKDSKPRAGIASQDSNPSTTPAGRE